ncbi:MAG: SDR family oxidoreductase [Pseudomonadota bacterium]
MPTKFQSALIVGGSRGVGRELATAFDAKGIQTHIMARGTQDRGPVSSDASGIHIIQGNATEQGVADKLLADLQPDLVVLTAGATPTMTPFHQMTWAEFSAAWDTDVRIAFNFLTAALTLPMKPGGILVSFSSGAGLSGSRLSGGYAGAKRMQHFLTDYARQEAVQGELGLRFLSIIPKQLVEGTEKGRAAASAYAQSAGIPLEQLWSQWDAPLTAAGLASHVAEAVFHPDKWPAHAYAITGIGLAELD